MCIELKTPTGSGKLSEHQEVFLKRMRNNKFYILVSNDYDEIIHEITKYAGNIVKETSKKGKKRKVVVDTA